MKPVEPAADKYCNVTTTRGSPLDFENLSEFECDDELLASLAPLPEEPLVVLPPPPQEPPVVVPQPPATVAADPVAVPQSPPSGVSAGEQPTTTAICENRPASTPEDKDAFVIFEKAFKEARTTQVTETEKHKTLKTPAFSNMTQNQYRQIGIHQKLQAQANEMLSSAKKSSYSSSSNSSKPARAPLGEIISFEQALGRPAQPAQPAPKPAKIRQVPKNYKKKRSHEAGRAQIVSFGTCANRRVHKPLDFEWH